MNIVIAGASRGIGKELARQYATRGDNVLMLSRDMDDLRANIVEFQHLLGEVFCLKCDVSKFKDVEFAYKFTKLHFEDIDLLIMNAGITSDTTFEDFNYKKVEHVFEVNVFGILKFMQVFLPEMKAKKKGKIAAISSTADVRGLPGAGEYSASKIALTHLMEAARIELKGKGIEVITIRPGFIKTQLASELSSQTPFVMEVPEAARKIIKAIDNSKSTYSFPWMTAMFTSLVRVLPNWIFDSLSAKIIGETNNQKHIK